MQTKEYVKKKYTKGNTSTISTTFTHIAPCRTGLSKSSDFKHLNHIKPDTETELSLSLSPISLLLYIPYDDLGKHIAKYVCGKLCQIIFETFYFER